MLSAMNVLLLLPLFKAIPFAALIPIRAMERSEEHTSELQSQSNLVCRLLLEKKKHEIHHQDAKNARSSDPEQNPWRPLRPWCLGASSLVLVASDLRLAAESPSITVCPAYASA